MAFFGDVSKQPLEEIENYILRCGNTPEEWFVGLTENWVARLFTDHNIVNEENLYIVRKCQNNSEARKVKTSLLALNCDGGQVGGSNMSLFVYAYKKTKYTNP